jgi:putative redox protein
VKIPEGLAQEHVDRLMTIAAKCPVHRTLEGEVMFSERVERATAPAAA